MDKQGIVKLWGIRGGIPTLARGMFSIGGNTPCVEIRWGKELLILDAGTGIWPLAMHLKRFRQKLSPTILFSHFHLDHIIGLPFFLAQLVGRGNVTIAGPSLNGRTFRRAITHAFRPPSFPIELHHIPIPLRYRSVNRTPFRVGNFRIIPHPLFHRGGSMGYRVHFPNGRSVVYATDSEPKSEGHTQSLIRFAKGADLLIHDAEYTPREYLQKKGWGHSPFPFPLRIAHEAGIPRLILFHHDPSRTDAEAGKLLAEAKRFVRVKKWRVQCDLACEGKTFRF